MFRILRHSILTALLLGGWVGVATAASSSNAPAAKATGKGKGKGKAVAAEVSTNAEPVVVLIPKSEFALPTEDDKALDPFYPDSARLKKVTPTVSTNKVAVAAPDVKINGFSGNPALPLVIINNVTFGPGDEQFVPAGTGRVRVRCIEIQIQDQVAVVEVNGVRRELRFATRK